MEAVLLDVGGVFVMPHPEKVGPALAVELDEARAARAHHAGVAAMDGLGKGDMGAYVTAYALEAGVPASRLRVAVAAVVDAYHQEPDADVWSWVLGEAVDALHALARTGVGLAVVSNSDGSVERLLRDRSICQVGEGDAAPVGVIVDSGVLGVQKPDPAIFVHALDALGVAPAAAVHVGDTVHADVAGARAAGVRPLHVDPFGFCPLDDHEHVSCLGEVADLLG